MIPEPAKQEEQQAKEVPNLWAEYERRKAELPKDMKPFDYVAACTQIAKELGI